MHGSRRQFEALKNENLFQQRQHNKYTIVRHDPRIISESDEGLRD